MTMSQSRSLIEKSILLIRILVGWVFVSEGIQKLLFPATLGVGRFTKIGIPYPHFTAPFVGTVEIVCGSLLLLGFLTRWATVPLLAVISVAIVTTKIPMTAKTGWWSMLHEARADFSMTLGLLFLLLVGAVQSPSIIDGSDIANLLFSFMVFLVAVIAGGVAALSGFGIGSLLTPLLATTMGMKAAVAAVSVPHFVATVVRLCNLRRDIDRKVLLHFGIFSAAGGLLGALFQSKANSPTLTVVFGVLLSFAGVSD